MTLLNKIKGRIDKTQETYKSVLKQNEDQVNENLKEIDSLSENLEQIFAEIKNCEEELVKVQNDYERIKTNLDATRPESNDYDLLDQGLIDKMLEAAEQRRNQYLSEINQTVELLNENLGEIRTRISELGTENTALIEASELLETSYQNMIAEFEDILQIYDKQMEELEDTLDKNLNSKKESTSAKKEPIQEERKKEQVEIPTVSDNIINISELLQGNKQKAKKEEVYDRIEDFGYNDEQVEALKLAIPHEQYMELLRYADEYGVNLVTMKTYFDDILGISEEKEIVSKPIEEVVARDSEEINMEPLPEIINLEDYFEPTEVVSNEEIKEIEPEFISSENIISFDKPFGSEEQVLEPELEEPVVVNVEEPTVSEEQPVDQEQKPEDNISEISVIQNVDEYAGIERMGLSLEQQQELKNKMSKETFIQILNIIQNNGVAVEDIGPYYEEFMSIASPQKLDEVFSLLRGAGKDNENFDLSAMLDVILPANPDVVQDNLLQAYVDNIDPSGLGIQILTSKYYDNIRLLNEQDFNTKLLMSQFPLNIVRTPLEEFIEKLKKHSSNKKQTEEPEEKGYGRGLAA